jgi:hypothetical protein
MTATERQQVTERALKLMHDNRFRLVLLIAACEQTIKDFKRIKK